MVYIAFTSTEPDIHTDIRLLFACRAVVICETG